MPRLPLDDVLLPPGMREKALWYLPTQIRFPIGGKRVTRRWWKLTNSLGRKKLANPVGNNNLNFRLTRDQVVLFESAANLCASRRQANDFFAGFFFPIFELGVITKHLTTGSAETVSFVWLDLSEGLGETKISFPWRKSLSAYCFPCVLFYRSICCIIPSFW